jgi:hypothetical protein
VKGKRLTPKVERERGKVTTWEKQTGSRLATKPAAVDDTRLQRAMHRKRLAIDKFPSDARWRAGELQVVMIVV